jgi:RimJ/RimL family protein N-acetyltransferase
LTPLDIPLLRAFLMGDRAEVLRRLQASVPADWPSDQDKDVLSRRLEQLQADAALLPWLLRAIVRRKDRAMVGHIGFHAAPGAEYLQTISPGAVEFGFTVFHRHRRQGYAREASLALMQWASQTHGVPAFVLSIRPDNLPSQALAAQLGFVRIGAHQDEVDGLEDILQRRARIV